MGGAERSARKKRQQQTARGSVAGGTRGSVPAARGSVAAARAAGTSRTKIIIGAVVVVLLAGAVIGGVLYTNAQKNKTEGQVIDPTTSASIPDYPVTRDGVVVVAGKPDAKVTIDIYEDFLCPHCRAFEQANAAALGAKLADGSLRVRYHMLAILNDQSDPVGYSMDSANAALCVADGNRFPAFHAKLFDVQPEEGSRGWSNDQLLRLATDLGTTTPDLQTCITSGRYDQQIESAQQTIKTTPHLQQDLGNGNKGFGTPTVASGDRLIDISDPNWLTNLLSAT